MEANTPLKKNDLQVSDIEAVKVIKAFYPLTLLRRMYLSATLFASKGLIDLAASGAFYFFLSIIPIVLLVVYVLDISIAGYGKLSDYFFYLLAQFNPQISRGFFEEIGLLNSEKKSFFGIIGVIGLIWSSRSVFNGIRSTFDLIFSGDSKRGFLKDNLISLIFVPMVVAACITVFIVVVVVKNLAMLFEKFGVPYFASASAMGIYSNIIIAVIIFFTSYLFYRFLPSNKPDGSDVVPGAALFALSAFILQKGLYGVITMASYYLVYGIISTLIVGLFWVYILFALFYFFAQFVYVQHMYSELEFNTFYINMSGYGNFIEKQLFKRPDTVILRFGRHLKAGETVYLQGDEAKAFYILLSGQIKTVKKNELGNEKVTTVNPNETFGESGALSKSFYEKTSSLDPKVQQIMLKSYLHRMEEG